MSRTEIQQPEEKVESKDIEFEDIVFEHQQSVRLFLARYVHCRQQVDDLAQEVFVTAYKQLKRFRQESQISTWLLGIARNKALQFLRTEARRLQHQDAAKKESVRISLENLQKTKDLQVSELRVLALRSCLAELPPKSTRLIEQFYFEKQTAITIALRQHEKEGTIRMKLKRIRNVLQKCIAFKLENDNS